MRIYSGTILGALILCACSIIEDPKVAGATTVVNTGSTTVLSKVALTTTDSILIILHDSTGSPIDSQITYWGDSFSFDSLSVGTYILTIPDYPWDSQNVVVIANQTSNVAWYPLQSVDNAVQQISSTNPWNDSLIQSQDTSISLLLAPMDVGLPTDAVKNSDYGNGSGAWTSQMALSPGSLCNDSLAEAGMMTGFIARQPSQSVTWVGYGTGLPLDSSYQDLVGVSWCTKNSISTLEPLGVYESSKGTHIVFINRPDCGTSDSARQMSFSWNWNRNKGPIYFHRITIPAPCDN